MSASSPVVRSTGAPQITWSRSFPAAPQQASEARRFLTAILDGRSAADDAVLCLSELASNAVLHSRSATPGAHFTVRATLKHDQLRVEVSDDGGPWQSPDSDADQQHGRGLVIVSRLATAWGRAGTPDTGWTVWFTIDCPPTPTSAQAGSLSRPESATATGPTSADGSAHPARPWITAIDGERLRQLRRLRRLTQRELADKAGLSLATVARLEGHLKVPCRCRTLARLAAALGERPTTLALDRRDGRAV